MHVPNRSMRGRRAALTATELTSRAKCTAGHPGGGWSQILLYQSRLEGTTLSTDHQVKRAT